MYRYVKAIDWTTGETAETVAKYRKWPEEFIWKKDAAKGHMPLTSVGLYTDRKRSKSRVFHAALTLFPRPVHTVQIESSLPIAWKHQVSTFESYK